MYLRFILLNGSSEIKDHIHKVCVEGYQTMKAYNKTWFVFQKGEIGQDLAEYALLLGLIAIVVMISISIMGENISGLFSTLASHVGSW